MSVVTIAENWMLSRPYVREQFEGGGGRDADSAALELARFFTLTKSTDRPLAMVNPNIDKLWHTFIEFTEDYGTFCIDNFGYIIHHRARTSTSLVPIESIRTFYEEYSKGFGELPSAWKIDTPSEIIAYGRGLTEDISEKLRWSGWPGRTTPLRVLQQH
jgi:hypothetical protein